MSRIKVEVKIRYCGLTEALSSCIGAILTLRFSRVTKLHSVFERTNNDDMADLFATLANIEVWWIWTCHAITSVMILGASYESLWRRILL
jgi:hypothetical protein